MKSIRDSISDLSILEIGGEDDSLLSEASTATDIFSCSPLVSVRSRPSLAEGREGGTMDSEDTISSPKDGANKENANWNKVEIQKLSVEPQQMKRKKKVGGYNLRKSLAWDRAFFTEQGVLNPLELSMISGTITPKSKSNLEVINEEEPVTTSLALQEIEENLFKHSSGARTGLLPKLGAFPKQTPSPASLAKRKVFADVVGNRSKRSACARPGLSSSTNTAKTPSKESKITRIPRPDVSANTTTVRSGMLTIGSSKRNQIPNVQKNAGVKGLSKNPKTVPSNPKSDSITRIPTKQTGKHLNNSVSKTHSQSGMHQPGSYANKVSEACLARGVLDAGEKKQQTVFQTTKSSGLRMPSPSLGFFSQAKACSSHGQPQKSSIPCKSSESNIPIPKLRKLEKVSGNEARSKIVERAAKNYTKELSLLDVKSEPSMKIDNKQMAGVEVECESLGSGKISQQAKVKNILEQGELHENENVSSMDKVVFPRHLKSHRHEQVEKEDDHHLENKLYDVLSNGDPSLFQEPQSMNYHSMQRTSNNISNAMLNAMEQDENEQIKLLSCDVLTFKESLVPQEERVTSSKDDRHFGESKECIIVKTARLNSNLNHVTETVRRGSIQGIPCKNTEKVNGAGNFDKCGGDAQVPLLDGNLSINCSEITQINLDTINEQLQGRQLKTPDRNIVGEIGSKKEDTSVVNSCQLVHAATSFSEGSPKKSILEIDGASESESKVAEIKDFQLLADGQSGFIPKRPMDEEYDQVIDSKEVHDRTRAFELERLSEDSITVSRTACCIKVTDVSPTRPFSENDIEDLCLAASQLCPSVQAGCDSKGNDMSTINGSSISVPQLRNDIFYRKAAVPCDVPGYFDQQASMFRDTEINKMPCKDESLVLNHGQLLHQNELSADLTSNAKYYIGSGAANSSGLLLHTPLAQSVWEFDLTTRQIEESHVEEAQAQSFSENPVAYDCSSKQCLAVNNNQFSLADDNNINEDSHLSEFQKSETVSIDSQNVNNILYLDSDCLPTNTAPFEEIKVKRLVEAAIEGCSIHTNEHIASDHHIQTTPENKDGNHVNEGAEHLLVDDGERGYSDILPSVEVQVNDDISSAEFDSSIEVSEDPVTMVVAWKPEEQCSSSKDPELLASHDATFNATNPQGSNVSLLNSKSFSEFQKPETVTIDSQNVDNKLYLDSDCLPTNIAPFEEIKKKSLVEDAIEGCMANIAPFEEINEKSLVEDAIEGCCIHTNEHIASDHHIQTKLENEDGNHVDEGAEHLLVDDGERGYSDILPSVEVQVNDDNSSAEFDSSIEVSEDPVTMVVAWKPEEQCSSSKNPELLASHDAAFNVTNPQGSNGSLLNSKSFSEFQKPETVTIDSQNVDNILYLDSDCLPTNIAPFEEIKKKSLVEDAIEGCMANIAPFEEINEKSLVEDAIEGCSIHTNEHIASDHHIQTKLENEDGNHVDEGAEHLLVDDEERGYPDKLPSVEVQINDDNSSAEFDSSIEVSEDPVTMVVAWKPEEQCSSSKNPELLASHDATFNATNPQGSNGSPLNSKSFSEFQKPETVTIDSQNVNNILYLDSDCLPTNIAPFEEIREKSLVEDAIEGCSIHTNEHMASDHHIQTKPENKDGNHVDEGAEHLLVDDGERGYSDILPSVEVQVNDDISSAEFDSSIEVSEDPVTMVVAWKPEEQCSSSKNLELLASHDATFNSTNPQGSNVSPLNSKSFSDEAKTNIFDKDKFHNTDMQRQTDGDINSVEDNSKIIHLEKVLTKSTQEVLKVKPPPNVAPFSEEWLAAIEAAGEEILTMKSGAVQNSPPDKNQQELGPWSPVKKNQAIGPFDCTKHHLPHSGS